MTRKLLTSAVIVAGLVAVGGCSGAPFGSGTTPPTGTGGRTATGTVALTPSGTPYDPPPCLGPAQLGKAACPTIANPYRRDVTAGGGGRE